jgi:hypothetical protein
MSKTSSTNAFATAQNLGALVANAKTIVNVFGAATARRAKIYDYTISADGAYTSTDTNIVLQIIRMTADGTGTAGTPQLIDTADVLSPGLTYKMNYTAEPTTGSVELDRFAFNQRATYRWAAVPGSELVSPATTANGICLRAFGQTGGYASTVVFRMLVDEQ